jgi:hypothetical protein
MLHALLLLIAAGMFVSCASTAPRVVVTPPAQKDVLMTAPLDVRFAEVHFDRMPIRDAVAHMAAEVCRKYETNYFSPGYRPVDPFRKRAPREPRVSFHGKNVTARDVFLEICRQPGWSFEWNVKGLVFSNGPGLSNN